MVVVSCDVLFVRDGVAADEYILRLLPLLPLLLLLPQLLLMLLLLLLLQCYC